MTSLKQTIYNALKKAGTPVPGVEPKKYGSPEEALDDFIKLVMAELFPEETVVIPMVVEPEPVKDNKEWAEETVPLTPQEETGLEDAMANMKIEEPKVEEPKKEKKKPGPKPKDKEEKPKKEKKEENVANNPTFTKRFKALTDELKVKIDKKEVLKKLNAMSKEEFNSPGKTLDVHMRAIMTPQPAPEPEPEPETEKKEISGCEVEFDGKTYLVDEEDEKKPVYEEIDGVYTRVGFVGMGKFEGMIIPDDE